MKLQLHLTDPKHGKYKIDVTGVLVFFLALVSTPVVVLISGFGVGSIIMMVIGLTGVVHFWVCFLVAILPFVKADMAEDKMHEEEQKSEN